MLLETPPLKYGGRAGNRRKKIGKQRKARTARQVIYERFAEGPKKN
jgi:hypothetical protein